MSLLKKTGILLLLIVISGVCPALGENENVENKWYPVEPMEAGIFPPAWHHFVESIAAGQRGVLLVLYFTSDSRPLSNALVEFRAENYENSRRTDEKGFIVFMREDENLVSFLRGKRVYFKCEKLEGSAIIENKLVTVQMTSPRAFPVWLVTLGILVVGAGIGLISIRRWVLKPPKVVKVAEAKPAEEAVTLLKPPAPPPFAGFKTDVGRVRPLNEDSLWVEDFSRGGNQRVLAMVADGMGGHAKGEVASRICVQTVAESLRPVLERGGADFAESIRQALQKANEEVIAYALDHPEAYGMGATMSVAVVDGGKLYVGHVGDTKVYVIDGGISQVTKDHSLVQELIDRGEIKPEEARTHPQRNVVTRAVGARRRLEVDTYSRTIPEGGYVLVCSDGLVNEVEEAEIRKLVLEAGKAQEACEKLVELANKRGGQDNISVVVVGPLKGRPQAETVIKRRPEK